MSSICVCLPYTLNISWDLWITLFKGNSLSDFAQISFCYIKKCFFPPPPIFHMHIYSRTNELYSLYYIHLNILRHGHARFWRVTVSHWSMITGIFDIQYRVKKPSINMDEIQMPVMICWYYGSIAWHFDMDSAPCPWGELGNKCIGRSNVSTHFSL